MASAPFREVRFGPRATLMERGADGSIVLRSPLQLGDYPQRVTDALVRWAGTAPERRFIAQRDASGAWRSLSYRQTYEKVRALAQALIDRRLSAQHPLVILSGNDVEHALLALASMHAGIPYAPVSVPYSLVSRDFGRLRHIVDLLQPGLVFAADGAAYAPAIKATVPATIEVVTAGEPVPARATTRFADLEATVPGAAVDAAHRAVNCKSIAKFLFTSGSTGVPKGVINTHGMMCSNQQMLAAALPFLQDAPPVLVDWLPWNHTFGGNHNFGIALANGGTFYIDEGKPIPGQIERTVANLLEIAPTIYFNVPKGYEGLLPFFERDRALRERFFGGVQLLFYAGAGLSQPVWTSLERLAQQTIGLRIPMITSLGSTETAPASLISNWPVERAGNVGVAAPGQQIKLVPADGKLELRVRGPNITPGYWKSPELTAAAFDSEGYYKMGDALRFADPADPSAGLLFDGRIAEDFKLATGTWVNVGALRAAIIAAGAPQVQDAVIAGHDRDDVTALIFPVESACRLLCPSLDAGAPLAQVLQAPEVRARFQSVLDSLARPGTGSATRVARALLLDVPPSLDVGEATDKGSLNQRAVLKHRADLVDKLYMPTPTARTLVAN